jgi:hypothetical protein
MASGDTLAVFAPDHNQPPTSNFASLDTRNAILVLDFDDSTDESAIFLSILPRNYSGNGLTVDIDWVATTATTGDCVWQGAFERMNTDIDSDSFASANSSTSTTSGTSGVITRTSIAFTNGAQIDSLAAGEPFRLRINRDANSGSDTMVGDAEMICVQLRET